MQLFYFNLRYSCFGEILLPRVRTILHGEYPLANKGMETQEQYRLVESPWATDSSDSLTMVNMLPQVDRQKYIFFLFNTQPLVVFRLATFDTFSEVSEKEL